jgi:Ser/Thr protein kinase RdoA (MazF antagonist)
MGPPGGERRALPGPEISSQPPLVQEAIAHFGLKLCKIESVPESYSSLVRILTLENGERLVLKVPFVQRKLHRELYAIQHLQDDLPVPQVVDYWIQDDGGPGALLLSLLPGTVISGAVSSELAYALGVLLGRLHTHGLERYGDVYETAERSSLGWWATLRRTFDGWRPLCAEVMPRDLFQRTLDRYAELYASLPEPDGPCWVHFDYRPGNVLVQGKRITGLIDFESSRGGSGGLDFTKIQNEVWEVWPGTREAFLRGYGSVRPVPELDRALPFYTLHNAFGGIAWCVRRSSIDDPFFDENMAQLLQSLSAP